MAKLRRLIFFTVIVITIAVFSYSSLQTAKAKEKEDFCLFCDTSNDDAKKAKQFAEKVSVIKSIFEDKVDSAVLAATVLYIDYEEGVEKYYQKDFKKSEFKANWNDIKNTLSSSNEDVWKTENIDNEKIDLLTAATIVMVLSNGFDQPYDEEAYKKALMLDSGFTDSSFTIGPLKLNTNDFLCSPIAKGTGTITTAIAGGIRSLNPFDDYTIGDTIRFMTNMNNICEHGFLEATYRSAQGIEDDHKRYKAKKRIAEKIIEIAKMYKPWFGIREESCVYQNVGTGEEINWRQDYRPWSNKSLGAGGLSVASAGCTSVSMAYLIRKSGTALKVDDFDPGVFVDNATYTDSCLVWDSWTGIAPNFKTLSKNISLIGSESEKAKKIADVLNTPAPGGYQQFVVLQTTNHWIAVDHVEGDEIYVLDPAYYGGDGLTTASKAWGAPAYAYNVFYATDVPFGSNGKVDSSEARKVDYTSSSYKTRLDTLKEYEQCSDRLRDQTLGNSNMCNAGCMVSALGAMYYMFTGKATDMTKLINDMIKEGEWSNSTAGVGTYFDTPEGSPIITEDFGLSGQSIHSDDKKKIQKDMISNLRQGKKILINLGGAKTTYSTKNGHFLMIDHYNEETKEFYIFNPNGKGTGYIDETTLMNEVLAYNKMGPWAISSNELDNGNNYCQVSTTGDILGFIASLEGSATCNYRGQGEGTGYAVTTLAHDSGGATTAFGITGWNTGPAAEVGYTDFKADLASGCTSKAKIDEMWSHVWENFTSAVKSKTSDISLTDYELNALASVAYGGTNCVDGIIERIRKYGKDSYEVFSCFRDYGCSHFNSAYIEGLTIRRMAEYEVFRTGNYNAARPFDTINDLRNITGKSQLEAYMGQHWPTSR